MISPHKVARIAVAWYDPCVPSPVSTNPPKPRAARGSPPKKAAELELRLAIARDGLGIELGAPARLGPLDVTELAMTLPAVRFPVDVSGGVQRFRHRRGVLERMTVELQADGLARAAAPELRGLLGEKTPQLFVAVRPWGATIGIADDELGRSLAFEIAIDAYEDELRLTVFGARGLGLQAPAASLASQAVAGMVKKRA